MKELNKKQDGESQWLPISDLMSVLMMIFLLIAVSYMLKVYEEKDKIEQVAITYNKLQNELYEDLKKEFQEDLSKWDAELDKNNLSVRFKSPEILFNIGSSIIKRNFKIILNDFFPRFIKILHSSKYKNEISEIRIEGHTSSFWRKGTSEETAYILNMELSQNRTRNVLSYVLSNIKKEEELALWTRLNVTANGLSSSKPIKNEEGKENRELSRRVEFRVKTNAEKRIANILNQ
ncbi:OmpA family protein [Tenacibaculum sp. 190524A02b]|uniref:OmpA family protein n=1 Tax=Tenacibaculum vairaonense TaxID=3137860 RepID=A0ABM9PJ56_9FLAO